MAQERLILITSTGVLTIPRTDFLSLEVELDNELAGLFKLRLATQLQPNGTWRYVDDERFQAWKPLTIRAGFNTTEELISGFITHIKPDFQRDPAHCTVEIWGMDASVLMDREEKLRAWPNEHDSIIAAKIFDSYGFLPIVAPLTPVKHDEEVSTIIQRETDMQFLKRLALRNGYECYVDGKLGFFRPPQLKGIPQPLLAVHFGESETNVNQFSLELNALTPTNVTMRQIDRLDKEILTATVESSQQRVLGRKAAPEILPPGMRPGRVHVSMNTTTGKAEMDTLCQELYHQAEWFLSAEGEIDGNHYAHVLKPHGTVTIKGIGEAYSGVYYVTHVTHVFRPTGYTQFFRAKRNALMTTGTEKFTRPISKPNPYLFDPNPYAAEPGESKPNPY